MKKTKLIFIVSLVSLISLLVIQINWIYQTAKAKEELFNEKATMVLSRTVETLNSDLELCSKMEMCCSEKRENCPMFLAVADKQKIDSVLNHYMNFYHFHIDYSFDVLQGGKSMTKQESNTWSGNVYKKRLEEVANKNGIELNLFLPDQSTFIRKEIGAIFISSVVLIVIVSYFFFKTSLSLIREKRLSLRTTQFLNTITHEFKTPMTNIGLAGKMLRKNADKVNQDKIMQYTSIILDENDKLKLQVEQILNMAALERNEVMLSTTNVDMHELIGDRVKCLSVQFENKNDELTTDLSATEFVIRVDHMHLSNVVNNLIENAIKYTHDNSKINVRTYNRGEKLIIEISDNGIGIAKEYQDLIFNEYFRIPSGNIHDVKGFGLGLAYVKKVIELHHGSITLESQLEKGSTFKIELPLK